MVAKKFDTNILNSFRSVFEGLNITENDIVTQIRELKLPELPSPVRQQLYFDGYELQEGLDSENLDISEPAEYFKFKERFVLVYQRDQFVSEFNYRRGIYGKFHICYCDSLKQAKSQNRYDGRYILTLNTDGLFKINLSVRDRDRNGKVYTRKVEQNVLKRLKVCQECLRQVNWMNFRKYCGTGIQWYRFGDKKARQHIVDKFDVKEFIANAEGLDLGTRPSTGTAISTQTTDYSLTRQIKKKLKELTGFCCEVCGKTFAENMLEIHHVNHNPGDNRRENLQVICKICHDLVHNAEGGMRNNPEQSNQDGTEVSADILLKVLSKQEPKSNHDLPWDTVLDAYKEELNRDSAVANYKLGKLFAEETFPNHSKVQADIYFSKCFAELNARAAKGEAEAQIYIADIHKNELGPKADNRRYEETVNRALTNYETAPEKFGADACYELSKLVANEEIAYRLKSKALELYKISAVRGNKEAAYKVSTIMHEISIFDEDAADDSCYWNDKAREQEDAILEGYTLSTSELIERHQNGDRIAEIKLYKKMLQGDVEASSYYFMHANVSSDNFKQIMRGVYKKQIGPFTIKKIKSGWSVRGKNLVDYKIAFIETGIPENIYTASNIRVLYGVTSIGDNAFYGCSSLTSLTIPDSVTSIGDNAFYGCSGLTSITIPDGVTRIRKNAFSHCESLTRLIIPNGVTEIENSVFSHCKNLVNIKLPDSVTSIGDNAFYGCSGLTSITIPDGVTRIGENAFSECESLTRLIIPDGVIEIENSVFSHCKNLVNIKLPDSVTRIGNYAFCSCEKLRSIKIPKNVTEIGCSAFYCCGKLNSITMPKSVAEIGSSAFYGCKNVTKVTIRNIEAKIGKNAFYGCKISSLTMPADVTTICCTCDTGLPISNITIPNGVTEIESYAFSNCENLTKITIPKSVTKIGSNAFSGCENLTSITIPKSVTQIGSDAFSGCSKLTSITIPEGVTEIGDFVFSNCENLRSVTIPDSITKIGRSAFSVCRSLESVNIPHGVTKIGKRAFSICNSLTSIAIPDNVTEIGESAFFGCNRLRQITIPDSVVKIGDQAFAECYQLKVSANLKKHMEEINPSAFK